MVSRDTLISKNITKCLSLRSALSSFYRNPKIPSLLILFFELLRFRIIARIDGVFTFDKCFDAHEVFDVSSQRSVYISIQSFNILMALRRKLWVDFWGDLSKRQRFYSSKFDLKKLRPMIMKRIENRAKDYPIRDMVPVAREVLKARALLIRGVSTLIKVFPVQACKFCPEVFIGEKGHLIQTCHGFRRRAKNRVHEWISGRLDDILVPVEAFHLRKMFQPVIEHNQRFDFERVPAVVELCWQAGADPTDEDLHLNTRNSDGIVGGVHGVESLSPEDLTVIANGTLKAWETLRSGVQRLSLVYPVKVCEHCSEVHVGPSGHKARLCGVFKYESWRGTHFWKKAGVDDLVPPKIVWHRRPQDPPVLLDEGRGYYGHAPAVVALCTKAGVVPPTKYFTMIKVLGRSEPVGSEH